MSQNKDNYVKITSSLPPDLKSKIIYETFGLVKINEDNFVTYQEALKYIKVGLRFVVTDIRLTVKFLLPNMQQLKISYDQVSSKYGNFSVFSSFHLDRFTVKNSSDLSHCALDGPIRTHTPPALADNANKYFRLLERFKPTRVVLRHQELSKFEFLNKVTDIAISNTYCVDLLNKLSKMKSLKRVTIEVSELSEEDILQNQFDFMNPFSPFQAPPVESADWYKVIGWSKVLCSKVEEVAIVASIKLNKIEKIHSRQEFPHNLVFKDVYIEGAIRNASVADHIEAEQVTVRDIESVNNLSKLRKVETVFVETGKRHILDKYVFKPVKLSSLMIGGDVKNCDLKNLTTMSCFSCHDNIDAATLNTLSEGVKSLVLYNSKKKDSSHLFKVPKFVNDLDIHYSFLDILDLSSNESLQHIEFTYGLQGISKQHKFWKHLPDSLKSINIRYKYEPGSAKKDRRLFGIKFNKSNQDIHLSVDLDYNMVIYINNSDENLFKSNIQASFNKDYFRIDIDTYSPVFINTFGRAYVVSTKQDLDKIIFEDINNIVLRTKIIGKKNDLVLTAFDGIDGEQPVLLDSMFFG